MSRIARVVAVDYPHHVTQRGSNRMDVFLDSEDRELFLATLRQYLMQTHTQVWAWCLMSNHFHLLLVPTTPEGMAKALHGVTLRFAQHFNGKYHRCGRLWQNRYYSTPLDPKTHLWTVARYIERNPVRAGIVRQAEDWRWSSARGHIIGESDALLTQPDWLEASEREAYRRHVNEPGDETEIRRATSTGWPIGGPDFIARLESILKRRLAALPRGRPHKKPDAETKKW
jgi:putative transposase